MLYLIVIVTTPRRRRTMNTTIIASQMLILIQSPPLARILTESATKSGPKPPGFALLTPPTRCRPHPLDVCSVGATIALVHTCVKGVDA